MGATKRREELQESTKSQSGFYLCFESQTPVARAQIHNAWEAGQSKVVRTGASALCVCYLICICLGCRNIDSSLRSTCCSWLLALGGSQNRVEAGRIPKRPKAHLPIRQRSGRSFLKLFRPNNASCLKPEEALGGCARVTMGGREGKQGDRAGGRSYLEIRRRL